MLAQKMAWIWWVLILCVSLVSVSLSWSTCCDAIDILLWKTFPNACLPHSLAIKMDIRIFAGGEKWHAQKKKPWKYFGSKKNTLDDSDLSCSFSPNNWIQRNWVHRRDFYSESITWHVFLHTRVVQCQQRSHVKEVTYSVWNVIHFQVMPDPLEISCHCLKEHSSLMTHIMQYTSRQAEGRQLYLSFVAESPLALPCPNPCVFAAGWSCLFQFIAQLFPWVRFKVNSRAC